MPEVPGVILAGGLARRMGGGDKSLLGLGGWPVLSHVIDRLRGQVTEIALNANGDPERFTGFGLPVLADSEPDFPGPLAGILAAMDWAAAEGLVRVLTVAADTPLFPVELVARLHDAAPTAAIALAATVDPERGLLRQPTFGLWPAALRDDLRAALRAGTRKVGAWTDRHGAVLAEFPAGRVDPFFNLNRPEDMLLAERMLGT
ncbi:MAG: molybdenum cofactor guanylyltransferase MobA [Rhodobacteraceae bacterium]|nr:molybdenum cofactor guanylyltransferase MobA [Paracoccaceae bacterium]